LPDGTKTQVLLALFERPYSHNEAYAYGSGKVERGVVISPNALDSFTVIFPDIFINGKKMDIPPVKFGISKAKYVPVLNC
jgi:hypothetical protein